MRLIDPLVSLGFFSAASELVAIPTGVQIFVFIATLLSGRVVRSVPMLFVSGAVVHHLFCNFIGLLLMRWSWWSRGSRVWSSGGKAALGFSTACPHGLQGVNRSVRTRPQIHRIPPQHAKGLEPSGYPYVISLKVTMRGVPEWPSKARINPWTTLWNC